MRKPQCYESNSSQHISLSFKFALLQSGLELGNGRAKKNNKNKERKNLGMDKLELIGSLVKNTTHDEGDADVLQLQQEH
ncbi:hypothetical protein LguiB_003537 [Lonicera macranthoides]